MRIQLMIERAATSGRACDGCMRTFRVQALIALCDVCFRRVSGAINAPGGEPDDVKARAAGERRDGA